MLLEMNVGGGVEKNIDNLAECVSRRLRAEKGQYQIWSFVNAPHCQRLTEILAMSGDMELTGSGIEQTAKTKRRVDREARQGLTGTSGLALQDVVHEDGWQRNVLQEIVDRTPAALRHKEEIDADRGYDEILVDLAVQFERVAVGRLPRIIVRDHFRGGGRAGTAGEPKR